MAEIKITPAAIIATTRRAGRAVARGAHNLVDATITPAAKALVGAMDDQTARTTGQPTRAHQAEIDRKKRDEEDRARADRERQHREARLIARNPGPRTPQQDAEEESRAQQIIAQWARTQKDVAVSSAAETARARTGAPDDYVRTVIMRESRGDPKARPITKSGKVLSSAEGYAQFLNKDWDNIWRDHGEKYVPGAAQLSEQERRAYRTNPQMAATMLGHRANEDAQSLTTALSKTPTYGEVYLAHWGGAGKAAALITAALREGGGGPATAIFSDTPDVISNHPDAFYDKGRPVSARRFIERFTSEFPRKLYEVSPPETSPSRR